MSASLATVGLLSAGVIFLLGGVALAIVAARVASAGRAARAEADIRLAASQELAVEVKRLTEKVEAALTQRDMAIENAFLRHNDACAASVQSQMGAHTCSHDAANGAPAASFNDHHDDDDDDHHKKHHSGGHHDDDDDGDHHKKHHAANDAPASFFARLFGRHTA